MSDPQVTQVSFFANRMYGNYDRTAEGTVEGLAGVDSIADAVANGAQAVNLLDTHIKEAFKATTNAVATVWRLDTALDTLTKFDALMLVHNLRYSYAEDLMNNIQLFHDANATYNGSTELTPSKYFSGILGKGRPYLKFDGIADKVVVSDSAHLDWGYGDGAIECIIEMPDVTTGNVTFAGRYEDANNSAYLTYISSTSKLRLYIKAGGTVIAYAECVWSPTINTRYHVIGNLNNGASSTLFINGVSQTLTLDTKEAGDASIAAALEFGIYNAIYRKYDMTLCRWWNRALTAAEALIRYNGWTHTPIPVADQWGANTELMPNQVDRDFSGASAWTNVDINAYNEDGDLTITADAIGQHCQIAVASAPTTATYKYRLYFDVANIVSSWAIKDITAAQTFGTVDTNGTNQFIEFTVEAGLTGGLHLASVANDSSADFDNFSLIRIGCVAEYGPDGLNNADTKWYDKSTNNLDGTVSGATYKDIIASDGSELDFTLIEFTEVEKQHIFFRLNPDGLTGGGNTDIGQIGAAKKFTPSTRPDFDMIGKDGYGIDGVETAAGRRSTNKRHGKRRRWQLTWSYINQSEKDDFEDFFDLIEVGTPFSNYPFLICLNYDAAEPIFHWARIIGLPEKRDLTYQAYAISMIIETEI